MILYKEEDVVPFGHYTEMRERVTNLVLAERKLRNPMRPHDFMTVPLNIVKDDPGVKALCYAYKLELIYALAFWAEPYSNGLIHRDLDAWALNLPLGAYCGKQVWVDVDEPPLLTKYGDTNEKPYEVYKANTPFKEKGSLSLDRPYFVCTNVLHYTNNSDEDRIRLTMSCRFKGQNPLTDS